MVQRKLLLEPMFVMLFALIPMSLTATSLQVSWNANTESDLTGYRVHIGNTAGNYTSCTDVGKATSYRINNVTQGQTYYIALTAYDTSGNESGYSQEVHAFIPVSSTLVSDTTAAIRLLSPTAGSMLSSLPLLRWSAQSVTQFTLYLAINNSAYYIIYSGRNTSHYLPWPLWHLFVPSGTTLKWYVAGKGSNGRSIRSPVSSFSKK